ncbi:MAG: hypothetical protein QXS37_06765 [Candidatus Aenigmatarchaeota archaeon]
MITRCAFCGHEFDTDNRHYVVTISYDENGNTESLLIFCDFVCVRTWLNEVVKSHELDRK